MRSISKLALGSAVCGVVTVVLSEVVLLCILLIEAFGGESALVLRIQKFQEKLLSPILESGLFGSIVPMAGIAGLLSWALGRAALRRRDMLSGEMRGRILARIGIALVVLALLNSCAVMGHFFLFPGQ